MVAGRWMFLAAAGCWLQGAALAQSVPMAGRVNGPVVDYWSVHQDVQGDTQYCVQTAGTYASGGSAGTTTLNRNDGNGNVSISGKVVCTWNDGVAKGSGSRNVGLYSLDVLDMATASNTSTSLVNSMSDYGTSVATNTPSGWFGKYTSADVANVNHGTWKTGPPVTVSGWLLLPTFRQNDYGGLFEGHDDTLMASPDGGAHWCNPYTYFHRAGGAGCDATNWSATGDAPKCGASSGTTACTDTAYIDSTHSSIMWKDPYPYDGSTGIMQQLWFITWCQDNACTGMPYGADSYLYGYGSNGNRTTIYLFRVAKNIASILDPSQYQWYSVANYSPTNTGNGASGNWTSTQASATNLWSTVSLGSWPAVDHNSPLTNWGKLDSAPAYLCSSTACSLTFLTTYNNFASNFVVTSPAPWGPFSATTSVGSRPNGQAYNFWALLPWTASASGSNVSVITDYSDYMWGTQFSITASTISTQPILTVANTFPTPWTGTVSIAIFNATGCWAALNGGSGVAASYYGPNQIQLLSGHSTAGCSGSVTGSPYWQSGATGSSQYHQNLTLLPAPAAQGAVATGGAGTKFTMGPVANALPRNGLHYYFDFYDHKGNTGYLPLATFDQARAVNHATCTNAANCTYGALPVAALSMCYNAYYTGCGFPQYSNAWQSNGIYITPYSNYVNGLTLMDLTGNNVQPALFSSDQPWTVSTVVQFSSASTGFRWFGAGGSNGASGFFFWTASGTGGAGSLCAIWITNSNVNRGVCSAGGLFTAGAWTHVVITRTTGVIAGSVHIYVNGVESPSYNTFLYAGGGSTSPVLTPGPVVLGAQPGSTYQELTGSFSSFGIWNRVLTLAEIKRTYTTLKAQMLQRGITLP